MIEDFDQIRSQLRLVWTRVRLGQQLVTPIRVECVVVKTQIQALVRDQVRYEENEND